MISYDLLLNAMRDSFTRRGISTSLGYKSEMYIHVGDSVLAKVLLSFKIHDRKNLSVCIDSRHHIYFKYLREPNTDRMVQEIITHLRVRYEQREETLRKEFESVSKLFAPFFAKAEVTFPDVLARRQFQTKFGGVDEPPELRGNCYSTCIANILDLEVEAVPEFFGLGGKKWYEESQEWLMERGLGFVMFPTDPTEAPAFKDLVCIAAGKSPRGHNHAVIWHKGKVLHDPHPDGTGFVGEPTEWDLLVVTNMARFRVFSQTKS